MLAAHWPPDEAALLAAIARDLSDPVPRLVYADWLDEQGDTARAEFLRDLLTAVDALPAGGVLPAAGAFPDEWLAAVGWPLVRAAREFELPGECRRLLALAKRAVHFSANAGVGGAAAVGASRLNGRPDLPAGVEWPRCSWGPLRFVAQFNLEEVAAAAPGLMLPAGGLWSLFIHSRGEGVRAGGEVQVLYTPPGVPLEPRSPPRGVQGEAATPAAVQFTGGWDVPSYERQLGRGPDAQATWEAVDIPQDHQYRWIRMQIEECHGLGHHLLGYGRVDPPPGEGWVTLAVLATDDEADWRWGSQGDGTLTIFARAEEVRTGAITDVRARYWWGGAEMAPWEGA